MKIRRSTLLTIGITAATTAAVTIFARNFISGEKKIKHRIAQPLVVRETRWTFGGGGFFLGSARFATVRPDTETHAAGCGTRWKLSPVRRSTP